MVVWDTTVNLLNFYFMNWTRNELSGQLQANFNAVLESVGDTTLENSNGTKFRIANVTLPNGKTTTGRMYETTLEKTVSIPIGKPVSCIATQYDNNGKTVVDIIVFTSIQGERISLDELEAAFSSIEQEERMPKTPFG